MHCNCGYLLACCCVTFFGCATQPIFVPLPTSHPASPWAYESPVPAQSGTLTINSGEQVPPNPDWQIPGMRDNEMHGHAAGPPDAMDMMGHGHMMPGGDDGAMSGHGSMMSHGDHGSMSGGGHAPGMVKMSAPPDEVDYAPEGAVHPAGPEPDEHKPELHLDHTDPARRDAGYKAAPIAPPADHGAQHDDGGMHENHTMPEPKKQDEGAAPATKDQIKEPAEMNHEAMDHEAMGHETMGHDSNHGEHPPAKATPTPQPTPSPTMDHMDHMDMDHMNHGA